MTSSSIALEEFNSTVERYYRRNFIAGLVHGVFFRASAAFVDTNTVLPAFVSALTGSEVAVGLMAAFIGLGQVVPELFAAYWVEGKPRKKPVLLGVITVRWISWVVLAWLTYRYGLTRPDVVVAAFLSLVLVFSLAGGVGTVVYADIFARAIPAERRGRFMGTRNMLGFALAIASGIVVRAILQDEARFPFPTNYTVLFLLSGVVLAVAFTGFALIKEPVYPVQRPARSWGEMLARARVLLRSSQDFRRLLIGQSLLMVGLALAPFYVVYARNVLAVEAGMIGSFVSAQMAGAALSNLLWGWLGDRFGNRVVVIGVALAGGGAPLVALGAPLVHVGLYTLVFVLLGATLSGMRLGFGNFLLEIAPPEVRPTCVALRDTLLAPFTLFPLVAGALIQHVPYTTVFWAATLVMLVGAGVAWRLREPRHHAEAICTLDMW